LETVDIEFPELGEHGVLVRTKAAGICHSDAHYRSGRPAVGHFPITLGHEVAGVVERVGSAVSDTSVGDRVCLHYLVTCGACEHCRSGHEQFCPVGQMLGKDRDGGYAELVHTQSASVFPLPDDVSFEWGAVMMCSSATSLHALRKARLQPGETVAVFGAGGLGLSAVQLARALGAERVFAVDIESSKLVLAERSGAVAVDASNGDPVAAIRRHTAGRGVDVALELIGLPLTIRQAVQSLANCGRAALVGITERLAELDTYRELIAREAEVVGVSDHLASEIPELIRLAERGELDLAEVITQTVPLEAAAINSVLDRLDRFGEGVRAVIVP
jgi:D-arabinose 1-dehydrogenase-like Zn-dependent alcohol dehydrogenase